MELARFQQIADLLEGSDIGNWLQGQIPLYTFSLPTPRVLALISAPRDIARVFPQSLQLDSEWQIWPENQELRPDVLEQTDLLLWAMTAMRMFPGEYSSALHQARQQHIPIWAIVVGMERLSEPGVFLRQRLPELRATLPANSRVFTVQDESRLPLAENVLRELEKERIHLIQQGNDRRCKLLTQRLRARLAESREATEQSLSQAERFAATAAKGVAARKILSNAAVMTILGDYRVLQANIAALRGSLLERVADEGLNEPLDQLPDIFLRVVREWDEKSFRPTLARQHQQACQKFEKWYADYLQEMRQYFQLSQHLLGSATAAEPELDALPFELLTDQLRQTLLERCERFTLRFRYGLRRVTFTESTEVTSSTQVQENAGKSNESEDEDEEVLSTAEPGDESSFEERQQKKRSRPFRQRIKLLIERGQEALLRLQDPTYDPSQQRKEVFDNLVNWYVDWFLAEVQLAIQQQQQPLSALLEEIQEKQGQQRLVHIEVTVTMPQDRLALLTEAEKLLRKV